MIASPADVQLMRQMQDCMVAWRCIALFLAQHAEPEVARDLDRMLSELREIRELPEVSA